MGPLGPQASPASGVPKESLASRVRRAKWELRVPRATKDTWGRWASPESLGLLAPQVLKGPGAP